jgi:2-(1,2-epoxy-1,2-dihydrophenyl)acetyl-CoA isomerase
MNENSVLIEKKDGIGTLFLNRPETKNSIDRKTLQQMLEALSEFKNDLAVKTIVITGKGKAFCAGGDLMDLVSIDDIIEARNFIALAGKLVSTIRDLGKPVIAMVNGIAAGAGFNIALACDIVFCAKSSKFMQSFSKIGLVPDCGGMYLLPKVIGLHKAKELMFTGDMIDAETAEKMGLVNRVVEEEKLEEETYKFASQLVSSAPLAIMMMKRVLNQGELTLDTVLELETDLQSICMQTKDHKEGVRAFQEKRQPIFKGK